MSEFNKKLDELSSRGIFNDKKHNFSIDKEELSYDEIFDDNNYTGYFDDSLSSEDIFGELDEKYNNIIIQNDESQNLYSNKKEDYIFNLKNGNMFIKNNKNRWGMIDLNGNQIIPFKYDSVTPIMFNDEIIYENAFIASINDKEKDVNLKGIVFDDGRELYSINENDIDIIDVDFDSDELHFSNSKIPRIYGMIDNKSSNYAFDKYRITIEELNYYYNLENDKKNSL